MPAARTTVLRKSSVTDAIMTVMGQRTRDFESVSSAKRRVDVGWVNWSATPWAVLGAVQVRRAAPPAFGPSVVMASMMIVMAA